MQKQSYSRGWVVTIAALSINLVLGVLYAWSVMGKALAKQWGPIYKDWTQTLAVLPFAVSTASFALTMIFAGRLQDKMGPKRIAMLGGFMLGIGLFASSYTTSPIAIALIFGVVGGMGIGLGYSATTPASIKWFPASRKGLITGIVVAGVGLASVYMAPLTAYLLGVMGIPRTFRCLGLLALIVVPVLAMLLRNPPMGYVAGPAGGKSATGKPTVKTLRNLDWHEMLATPQFYFLWIMFILAAAPGLMLIANAAQIAGKQASWEAGFYAVMVLAIFNTLGRVLSGYVSDRIGRTNTMMLFFVLQAGNMLAFSHYTDKSMLICGLGFAGLCYGTIFTLMPAAVADFYGLKNMGVNYGLLFTAFGVAGCAGSLLGGRVRDIFGSYDRAYQIVAIALLVAAVLAFLTRAPKTPEADEA